jgi:predicted flap endonuclease-1-like 5' DNA nuclease
MNHTMKNVIRFAGVVAGLAAAVWALRDRMLPDPQPPSESHSKFRTGTVTAGDDLTEIKGIGPAFASRLVDAGIESFATLAKTDPAAIAEIAKTTETVAERWIASATDRL